MFSNPITGGFGGAPVVPWSPIIDNWRDTEGLVRGMKMHKECRSVIIIFLMSWLFAIIVETKRVLFLCSSLHLMKLKVRVWQSSFEVTHLEYSRADLPD